MNFPEVTDTWRQVEKKSAKVSKKISINSIQRNCRWVMLLLPVVAEVNSLVIIFKLE